MKVSIITVSYNSYKTINQTIDSVLRQTHPNIEYIIIDNNSKDGTVELVKSYGSKISKFLSEPDKGMYNAMNKGVRLSSGDIVGILNSDDFFFDENVVKKLVEVFEETSIQAVYGDVQFVHPDNFTKIVRYYSSKYFSVNKFRLGFMPAHPSFYTRREYFELLGYYKEDYKIAADFELLCRFLLINKLKSFYLEMPFVSMRPGGISNKSLLSIFILNNEILRACKENCVKTNILLIYLKYFKKILELFGNQKYKQNSH